MLPPVMMSAVAPGADGKPQLTVPFGDGVLQCLDTTLAGKQTCNSLPKARCRARACVHAWPSLLNESHGLAFAPSPPPLLGAKI